MKLKQSAEYSHYGQQGVLVTAKVKRGQKFAKGKVKFTLDGQSLGKVKLEKGKAEVRLAPTLAPGNYTVKAKYKTVKKKAKVTVYDSSLALSATEFVISKSADSFTLPELTGSVRYKGKDADQGYVDIYENGDNEGGSESPNYCCMAGVGADGTFGFSGYSFLGRVQEAKAPGTYQYKAFYTDGPEFADYIYSSWITVTVTP
jgi:hypothetical protein